MQMDYSPLPMYPIKPHVCCHPPRQSLPDQVELHSPALFVMTDLRRVLAVTVAPQVSIQSAMAKMKHEGVHMLLVTNPDNEMLGLITSTDIQGEKPLKHLEQFGGRHEDIEVQDIMTPHERLEVLLMCDVLKATVGDVVATLQRAGRQHALVVDGTSESDSVRGIFSCTQISRQLAMPVEIISPARTFAELEVALNV